MNDLMDIHIWLNINETKSPIVNKQISLGFIEEENTIKMTKIELKLNDDSYVQKYAKIPSFINLKYTSPSPQKNFENEVSCPLQRLFKTSS